MTAGEVRIGTSGWQYAHWRGDFYPRDLPEDRWLEHYASEFDTVELNNSFYRLPDADAFARWARRVPDGFVYAVKASRYLTHLKRLREADEPLERLWSRARRLGDRLGPMLYQLPPRWQANTSRLGDFLALVPDAAQAMEFRDASWYRDEIVEMLEGVGVGLCLHDMPGSENRRQAGPLVYLRFHGSGARYGGAYTPQQLAAWAGRVAEWSAAGLRVWAYFNNDVGGHAVRDAQRLRRLVERRTGGRASARSAGGT